jgi:hypothetical protein
MDNKTSLKKFKRIKIVLNVFSDDNEISLEIDNRKARILPVMRELNNILFNNSGSKRKS